MEPKQELPKLSPEEQEIARLRGLLQTVIYAWDNGAGFALVQACEKVKREL